MREVRFPRDSLRSEQLVIALLGVLGSLVDLDEDPRPPGLERFPRERG